MSSCEPGAAGVAAYAFEPLQPPPRPPDVASLTNVLAEARAEADAIRAAARAEGRAAGYAEGRAAGLVEAGAVAAPALAALAAAQAGVERERDELAHALERQAVELALALAEKVLAGSLSVQPERVLDVVRGALRGLMERERLTLLVHPNDLERVRAGVDALKAELGGIGVCDVQAERRVAPGGAVVRTLDGEVDARIEAKLERAREIVAAELG